MKRSAKCIPKKQTTIVYIVLICFSALLASVKWYGDIYDNAIILPDVIHSHITNFSISLIFYLAIGYPWLLYGIKIRNIIILGLVMLAANFTCETLMAFINTVDIVDALYGSIGTALGFVFLLIVYKYGLQKDKTIAK